MSRPCTPLAERFWAKVQKSDDPKACWIWTSPPSTSGYGKIGLGGKYGSCEYAHRIAWILANGPIPDGLQVCHTCDVPLCVRNDGINSHIFLGTNADNVADSISKGRNFVIGSYPGELHGNAKLTDNDVVRIRELYKTGISRASLVSNFGVSKSTIDRIVTSRGWKHIIP